MHRHAALLLVAGLTASGCSGADECTNVTEGVAETVTSPEVDHVPVRKADVVLIVTSASAQPVRVRTRVDDGLALDVRLPAGDDYCGHEPAFSYGLSLTDGVHAVEVDADGRSQDVRVSVADQRRWIVVTVQDGFPLHVDAFRTRPQFG